MINHVIDKEFLEPADSVGREGMKKRLLKKHGVFTYETIARSILSRPIEAYFLGRGRRYVLVTAAHHALESITSNIAYLLIDVLCSRMQKGMIKQIDCKLLLSKYCFVIVPCVNPDGIELRLHGVGNNPLSERQRRLSGGDFSLWQANGRGVDLNHNYDFGFSEYKVLEAERGITAGQGLFSGEYPESEPESRGVANLVRVLLPLAVVSLHTQGEVIYSFPTDAAVTRCALRLSSMCGYTHATPEDTARYGGLCDFTGSMGIPSFTYELGLGTNPLPESVIQSIFSRVAESILLLPTIL